MTDDVEQSDPTGIDEMGPVDYLVVEFPGNKMTGEGLPLLVDLVDRGIIRILDFAFVMKETDGTVHGMEIGDFDGDGQLDLASSRARRRGCSARRISPRPEACWSPGARRASSSTRTCGPRPSPGAEARRRAAGREWSHSCPGPARRGRSLPARLRGLSHQRKAENDARTSSRSRANRCDCRDGHRRVEPGLPAPGRTLGPAGPAGVRAAAAAATAARVRGAGASAAAPETSMDDKLAQLKDLAALKEQGVLTDYEFEAQKARILNN